MQLNTFETSGSSPQAVSVYFMQAAAGGPIKIGYTRCSVKKRMAQLQTGTSEPLKCLGTINGGKDTEAHLHQRFSQQRLHGEWFKPSEELLRYIATEATPYIPEFTAKEDAHEEESEHSYFLRMENEVLKLIEELDTALGTQPPRIDLPRFLHFMADRHKNTRAVKMPQLCPLCGSDEPTSMHEWCAEWLEEDPEGFAAHLQEVKAAQKTQEAMQ
jgi:Meiotically up-regulated gene 113